MGIKGMKAIAPLLALTLFAGACDDDPVDEGDEPNVGIVRLTVGTQTVTWTKATGAVTGGPIVLTANTNVAVTAAFLLANGNSDPVVTAAEFRLEVEPASSNVTFTSTGAFTGTLRGATAGTTTANFQLHHIPAGHDEMDFNVSITVQ
ncbi:MAG: hypothetical protein ACT4O1_04560 [Gemmatimonadota bacterium]